ncbi:MAG: hypothetical protein QXF52_07380 [Thermoproteota archaeon]
MSKSLRKGIILAAVLLISVIVIGVISTLTSKGETASISVDCSIILGEAVNLLGVNNGPLGPRGWEGTVYSYNFTDYYMEMGVNFIRVHDLWGSADIDIVFPNFNSNPYDEAAYNFSSTDRHISAMLSTGAHVIFRLGYSYANPPKNHPPADYEKWAEVCLQIVKHYNGGWANGMNQTIRYWEVWNEPDIEPFWKGTLEEYFRLYDVVARKIKEYDSSLLVGGPAIAWNLTFLRGFLQRCRGNGTPLDFVSWHIYTKNPYEVYLRAVAVCELMEEYGFSDKLNVITEWNFLKEESESYELFRGPVGAAFSASSLIYLQNAGVDIATFYRGDSWPWGGIFYENGVGGKVYYVMVSFRELLENSIRVGCEMDIKDQRIAAMATVSEDGKSVSIVISNYGSKVNSYQLQILNLPWGEQVFFYELFTIDEKTNLTMVASGEKTGDYFEFNSDIGPYAVHILRLKAK